MTDQRLHTPCRHAFHDARAHAEPGTRPAPLKLVALIIATLAVASPATPLDGIPEEFRNYLVDGVELSGDDVRRLKQGEVVSKKVDTDVDQELAAQYLVRIDVPAAFVRKTYPTREMSMETAEALEFGTLVGGWSSIELGALTLDEYDIDGLRKCKVGRCSLKLDAEWIRRFRDEVNWSAPTSTDEAVTLYRDLLGGYASAYRHSGDAALTRYHDKRHELRAAEQFRGILQQSPYLYDQLPDIYRYLERYPAVPLDGLTDSIFWMKEDVGAKKKVTTLVHWLIYAPPGSFDLMLVNKQIYANHYFESALGLTRIIADADGAGVYLIHVYRARIDSLRGWGLFHGRIRRGIRNKITERLETTKRRIETRWRELKRPTVTPSTGTYFPDPPEFHHGLPGS